MCLDKKWSDNKWRFMSKTDKKQKAAGNSTQTGWLRQRVVGRG